jgi:hypothetical protein
LLAYHELDDALGLTDIALLKLLDGRPGKKHTPQAGRAVLPVVFGRLAGTGRERCWAAGA